MAAEVGMLAGLRVVEGSAFVAAPLGGTIMAEMGADVIRFDPIGGGIDYNRWPTTPDGFSLYWAGLNQGKRSVALDVSSEEGRDLALSLASAPGDDGGITLTNHPPGSWFSYEALKERRADAIMCRIEGHADGRPAVDYTINAATGLPLATGTDATEGPTNSVLPAWDVVTGHLAVIGLLAAERGRRVSGSGDCIRIALADVANGIVGHLGYVAEASLLGRNRPRVGNGLYGAFGRDFETADGARVMIVAITVGQFRRLVEALELGKAVTALEQRLGTSLSNDEDLFHAQAELAELVDGWVSVRALGEVAHTLNEHRVLWGPYQNFVELATGSGPWSVESSGFKLVEQPGAGAYPMPSSPIRSDSSPRAEPKPAPLLGEHTGEVLEELLGLSPLEVGRLNDRRVIALRA